MDKLDIFREKKLITELSNLRGNGTSMLTLIIPPIGKKLSQINSKLNEEYATASNIKCRVNRQSVETAIKSIQSHLKNYKTIPKNGLILCFETERKIQIIFEPTKPINTTVYMCDNKFHLDEIEKQLCDTQKVYGYIIIDGHECVFATVQGNVKSILEHIKVDLPNKHGRGGQSAQRFGRIRLEKRFNYITKVSEIATDLFSSSHGSNNNKDKNKIDFLILAGLADFKDILSNRLIPELQTKILCKLDVSYGGNYGLSHAIKLSANYIESSLISKEIEILDELFLEMKKNSDKYCFGLKEIAIALDMGAVEKIICFDKFEENGDKFFDIDEKNFFLSTCGLDKNNNNSNNRFLTIYNCLIENAQSKKIELVFVSNATSKGEQLVQGLGGIAAILRYTVSSDIFEVSSSE